MRWLTPLFVVLLSVGAGAGLYDLEARQWRIALDPSEEPMIPADDPGLASYRDAVANFGDDDLFVVAMQTDNVFTHAHLAALRAIGDRIRRIHGVRSIESIVETTVPAYDDERDLFEIRRFVDEIPSSTAELLSLRRRALEHPLFSRSILSPDGRSAAINVAMRTMSDREYVTAGINERIEGILAEHSDATRRFYVTGRQHIKAEAYHIMVHDLLTLIPIALLVGALVAWLASGRPLAGAAPVAASAVAMLWVFAYIALADATLNIITLVLGPMLLCVGSVYGVHVIARYDSDETPGQAVRACIERVRAPVLLASVTTMAGFIALATSSTPAIRELAALSVMGIAIVTMLSLTALPGFLSLTERTGRGTTKAHEERARRGLPAAIDRMLHRCQRLALHHPGRTLGVWAALGIAALAALPTIQINTDYLSFFDRNSRIRTDFDTIGEVLAGPVPIYVSLSSGIAGAFREPDTLRILERLQERLDSLPGVTSTLSAVDLLRQANRAFEYDDPKAAVIPATKGEVSDLFLIIPKTRMRPFANANQSSANIIVRTADSGSAAIRALESELIAAIDDVGVPSSLRATVTGSALLLSHNADSIAVNQFTAVGTAALTIFVLITLAMKSVKLGALAMLPNILPVLMFFGLLGAGLGTLSLPTSLLGCIAMGIAVDDTAHFLVDYHRHRAIGLDSSAAAARCIETLGRPIVVTSLMLSAGFLVLGLSGFATLRELGRLAAVTMFLCLCADLTLLPALLVRTKA